MPVSPAVQGKIRPVLVYLTLSQGCLKMAIIWREIENSGGYWVSNDGKVKRNGKLISESHTPSGWPRVRFYNGGKPTWHIVWQLVINIFGDDHKLKYLPRTAFPEKDLEILGGTEGFFDNSLIVNSPLFDMYEGTVPYKKLAKVYGVSTMTIYYIKWGRLWPKVWSQHH